MKTVHIICSIKNLNQDYEHLQWLRMFFLSRDYRLSEDWINHSLMIRNKKPYFKSAPNFDYMKVATDSVNSADMLVFLMSEPSTFTLTMLRYATNAGRKAVVICRNKSVLRGLDKDCSDLLRIYTLSNYQVKLKAQI